MKESGIPGEAYVHPVVAKILDSYNIVINKGSFDGIKTGARFLVYELSEDIIDPITKVSLGSLELSKGTGEIVDVFDRKAILRSDMKKRIPGTYYITKQELAVEPEKYLVPFKKPKEGDIAKLIV